MVKKVSTTPAVPAPKTLHAQGIIKILYPDLLFEALMKPQSNAIVMMKKLESLIVICLKQKINFLLQEDFKLVALIFRNVTFLIFQSIILWWFIMEY